MMKAISRILSVTLLVFLAASLAACASHRKSGGAGEGGAGANGGAYAQGVGEGSAYGDLTANCNVPQTPGFKTQSFYFAYDKDDIHPEDMSRIQGLAQSIAAKHSSVSVKGNADDRGSREYNVALGLRRANTLVASLKQSGVSPSGISSNSNGAEKPIAFGTTEQDYACNRRVDVLYRD